MFKYIISILYTSIYLFAFDLYEVSLSSINGTSKEIVYDDGKKLSELTWRLDDVDLLGLKGTYISNDKVVVNASIKINTGNPDSTMDDYDWLSDVHDDWTHWSHHPETKVKEVFKFDVNVQGMLYQNRSNTIYGLLGYKYDTFKWVASNTGDYVYTSVDNSACNNDSSIDCTYNNNYRDRKWSSTDDSAGITYNQYFNGVYIGAGLINTFFQNIVINGEVKYSSMFSANDEDTHHNRDLYFEENFEDVSLLQMAFNLKYLINKQFSFFLGYSYLEYELTKGNTYVTDLSTGIKYYSGEDTAGISHESSIYTYGLKIAF